MTSPRRFLAVLLALLATPAPAEARDAAGVVPAGDVAALTSAGSTLFVGAFDRGVTVVGADGATSAVDDPALNPNVNALVATRDGRTLWIGTARGLTRCRTATPWGCERVGSFAAVHAVVELRNGAVLAGGEAGILAVFPDGSTRVVDRKHGARFRAVWALAESEDGTVFVGATNGLHWARSDALLRAKTPAPEGGHAGRASMVTGELPDDWVTSVAVAGDAVHVGTYNAGIVTFRRGPGTLEKVLEDPSLGYVNPRGITPLADGTLAVATMDGLRVGVPGRWRTVPTPTTDVTAVEVTATAEWVATRRGVVRVELGSE